MKSKSNPLPNLLWLLSAFAAMVFWACQLTQDVKNEDTVSFTKLYDSLKQYDQVIIVFKDGDGILLDTVFNGKVGIQSDIEGLHVRGWDGGEANITIVGLNGGVEAYEVEKHFNGTTDKTDTTVLVVVPGTSLSSPVREIVLAEGDSALLPEITVSPTSLSNKAIGWSNADPDIVELGKTSIKGLATGTAELKARLISDPSRSLTVQVTVTANGRIPTALSLSPDTLYLAAGGAAERFGIKTDPSGANNAVSWASLDSTCALPDSDGLIKGLRNCATLITAASKEKTSVVGSAWVVVSDPVPVASVLFIKDSAELFVGGAAESLLVDVLPAKANRAVAFASDNPAVVEIKAGRINGLMEGSAKISVASKENPAIGDTLRVRVSVPQLIESVQISPRTLRLFTGGESLPLTSSVLPASSTQKTLWRSSDEGVAKVDQAGKVSPVSTGVATIYATSLADSTKKDSVVVAVKRDVPRLLVGQDTIVPVGQVVSFLPLVPTQEYGLVTIFKWDLDGDLAWDDSSGVVKTVSYKYDQEKEYPVRFYVRDSEGNDTISIKKVKAVKGPIVLILSPLNNAYTNQTAVTVRWSIDGVEQDSLPKIGLKDGANVITRMATDAAGNPYKTSITVYLDTLEPNGPLVHGPAATASLTPTWTWKTGGSGGNGVFRFALDNADIALAAEGKDTLFTPETALTEETHTLFVQERDAAGNWSASGSLAILIDASAPGAPNVKASTPALTNVRKPIWSWTGASDGSGSFEYKVDNGDFSAGGTVTTEKSYVSLTNMSEGPHTVYVREKDGTGNWSPVGSATVTIDITPPNAPKLVGSSPTSVLPKWTWTGGGGGSGKYRFKLGGDGNPAVGGTETLEQLYILATASSGLTYTLYLQESDAAGNWSAVANLPVKYDLTKPTLAISAPQASGTFITTLAKFKVTILATGPNVISKVVYSLDGAGATAMTAGAGGSWATDSIAIADGKTIVFTATATDALGNTGEATVSILRDSSPPTAPVSLTVQSSPTNVVEASWTWTAGNDGVNGSQLNGQYRYNLNGGAWATTTTASASLDLKEGSNTFSVQEQDNAGNWSASASSAVALDTKAPDAVAFSGTDNVFTTNRLPTWSWSPSTTNPGIADYDVTLEGPDGTTHWSQVATTWKPTSSLLDGVYKLKVRQKDQVAGILGTAKAFTIKVDGTSPSITVNGYSSGGTAILTGSNTISLSGVIADNSSGSGLVSATWEMSGGTNKGATNISTPNPFSISSGTLANHAMTTITMKATDAAGNSQTVFTLKVTVEVPEPTITFSSNVPEDGFVTSGSDPINYTYSINGGSNQTETITFTNPVIDQYVSRSKTYTATNAIGTTISVTKTFYRVNSDVRFFSPTGGDYDCKSWKTACKFDENNLSGKDNLYLWLLSGDYDATGLQIPAGTNVYGNLHSKSKLVSEQSGQTTLSVNGNSIEMLATSFNNLRFTGNGANGVVHIGYYNNSTYRGFDHCVFDGIEIVQDTYGSAISGDLNEWTIDITDTEFNNIESISAGAGVYINGYQNTLNFLRCTFKGTRPALDAWLFGNSLQFKDCNPTQPNSYPSTKCDGTTCNP